LLVDEMRSPCEMRLELRVKDEMRCERSCVDDKVSNIVS
jgi:hypothetical protein